MIGFGVNDAWMRYLGSMAREKVEIECVNVLSKVSAHYLAKVLSQ